ncbi:hypothetical protein GCM10009792_17130 [Microcella alkalica]|uniref:Uncharacterized protein n=1 Tax=Microcella alkalica TaxID=355930 RepID=A0A839E4H3_9MICO|nr:hypothetical protein [Microcella alkalica]MBA8847579.1 hypothetical protein [Microcella alkalica]
MTANDNNPRSTDDEFADRELLAREVDHDAERPVDLDDALDEALPPPTIDPDERVEVEPDPDLAIDDERPAG